MITITHPPHPLYQMVVVSMPGATLRDAIAASRGGDPSEEKRAFLQLDDGVDVHNYFKRLRQK